MKSADTPAFHFPVWFKKPLGSTAIDECDSVLLNPFCRFLPLVSQGLEQPHHRVLTLSKLQIWGQRLGTPSAVRNMVTKTLIPHLIKLSSHRAAPASGKFKQKFHGFAPAPWGSKHETFPCSTSRFDGISYSLVLVWPQEEDFGPGISLTHCGYK